MSFFFFGEQAPIRKKDEIAKSELGGIAQLISNEKKGGNLLKFDEATLVQKASGDYHYFRTDVLRIVTQRREGLGIFRNEC